VVGGEGGSIAVDYQFEKVSTKKRVLEGSHVCRRVIQGRKKTSRCRARRGESQDFSFKASEGKRNRSDDSKGEAGKKKENFCYQKEERRIYI